VIFVKNTSDNDGTILFIEIEFDRLDLKKEGEDGNLCNQ
jgi:hypothetical protein